MSSSYGHAIARIGGLASTEREVHQEPHWDRQRRPNVLVWRPACARPRCLEKPEFVTRYLYVTGRAGRVTDRIQYCCREHGEAFAKKHGLELPAIPVQGATAGASGDASAPEGSTAYSTTAPSGPEDADRDSVGGQS